MAWIRRAAGTSLAEAGRGLSTHVGPAARRGLAGLGRAVLAGAAALGRGLVQHRGIVAGLLARGLWWVSLALLVQGGLIALGAAPLADLDALPEPFVRGAALCLPVVLLAPPAHLRRAGIVLGALHVALATAAYVALATA